MKHDLPLRYWKLKDGTLTAVILQTPTSDDKYVHIVLQMQN